MNEQEYKKWESDARRALSGKYGAGEIETVLDWFRGIRSADERDLIDNEAVDAFLVFTKAQDPFDLYDSLMARAFIYAPLILRDARESNF